MKMMQRTKVIVSFYLSESLPRFNPRSGLAMTRERIETMKGLIKRTCIFESLMKSYILLTMIAHI